MSQQRIPADDTLPLKGLRIVEINDGKLDMCARFLADLGADVILIEPPQGSAARQAAPLYEGQSLYFATHHANKRSVVLDLIQPSDQERFLELLGTADLFLEATQPGTLDALGLGVASLQARWPGLSVLSISDFGQSGPYRDYAATNAVHTAMSGVLCRSGKPGLAPLMPPGSLAWEAAAVQATWVALLALWQKQQTGVADHLDLSIHETVAQVLDPALGVTGSAAAGTSALDTTPHGRPVAVPMYPMIPCQGGYVRICVLNPRQWEAMSSWLGPNHPFTDPQYSNIAKRMAVVGKLNEAIGELFSQYPAAELVAEGQRRGVPIAAVATPADALKDAHFNARQAFVPLQVAPGMTGQVPAGYLEIDGRRAGIRNPAPALGADTAQVLQEVAACGPKSQPAPAAAIPRRPLQGVRVLDLGVIVAGSEAGRILADQGADVIKVENRAFPDGGRQSMTGAAMTTSIALGHRNKRSAGINLKSEKGREMFKQLVAQSDVVLSNFKPGTLASLGLGYDVLSQVNPGIIMMDSSALGNTGPQSRSLGYGPLVRAATGLSWLWSYPDVPGSFSDGVTIYPDHLAGRVAAVGVMSLLLRRARTGRGGEVSVSQAEIFLNGNAEHYLRESLQPGSFVPRGNASEFQCPDNVYPCAGEDEWCVVSTRDDADWQRLLIAIGRADLLDNAALATTAGRLARRAEVDALVAEFTRRHSPREVTQRLQGVGVPAGFMQRLSEYRGDPHFSARGFIRTLTHPGLANPLPTENGPVLSRTMPEPELRPAPYQGEHTREVAAQLLGLSSDDIQALIASGDLEDMAPLKV
jgi:crotonobetainyl-CoA:carnitine CoA-transferase CaiB-like acyl-CoA transferase